MCLIVTFELNRASHQRILDLADFTLAATDVRTGTTGAALAFCKARPISLTSTCVRSASPRRTP